jgi:tetratricopeptide (TPR) repeat protein
MSMTPRAEDFERLIMRWAAAPQHNGYTSLAASLAAFPERYAANRDALPQNDSDRAFGLVTRACELLNRSVVKAETDEEAQRLTDEAAGYIDEALKLDPQCYDAVRINRYLQRPSRDEMASFLEGRVDEVRAGCLAVAEQNGALPPEGRWSVSPYVRPYLRWVADLANEQLACGRYRLALARAREVLATDENDLVGARHIAAFACVKLEDEKALDDLMNDVPFKNDAWYMLSECFMAYKGRRLEEATETLHKIVRTFPAAGCTLMYQDELPPGVFGHLEYADGTADELYVAVSEAAVVLDENCGEFSSALSGWIADDPVVAEAYASEEALALLQNPSAGPDGQAGAGPTFTVQGQ